MGTYVSFFCGPDDDKKLIEMICSIDLKIYPPRLDMKPDVQDPSNQQLYYLSFLDIEDLNPYGEPAMKIGDATDPLISLTRSYYQNPYIVAGNIYWSNDDVDFCKQTKPYFSKITRWIRENWEKEESGFYVGPHAKELVQEENAKTVSEIPGSVEFKTIEV